MAFIEVGWRSIANWISLLLWCFSQTAVFMCLSSLRRKKIADQLHKDDDINNISEVVSSEALDLDIESQYRFIKAAKLDLLDGFTRNIHE